MFTSLDGQIDLIGGTSKEPTLQSGHRPPSNPKDWFTVHKMLFTLKGIGAMCAGGWRVVACMWCR